MVSPNMRVINVGRAGRRCRDIQHDHDGCMAAGGARGHYTWPKAVKRGHAGPNLIYITLYG